MSDQQDAFLHRPTQGDGSRLTGSTRLACFSLTHFKAFRDRQDIELRPINLVFGHNSAGKSTIIQSLLLLAHGSQTGEWDVHQTALGGQNVDLGGYDNYVHRHERDRGIGLSCIVESEDYPFPGVELQIRPLDCSAAQDSPARRSLSRLALRMNGRDCLVLEARRPDALNVVSADLDNALFAHWTRELSEERRNALERRLAALEFTAEPRLRVYPRIPAGARIPVDATALDVIEVIGTLASDIVRALEGIDYLGPSRAYPDRHELMLRRSVLGDAGTGYSYWARIAEDADLRETVNHWLTSPTRLGTRYALDSQRFLSERWVLGLTQKAFETYREAPEFTRQFGGQNFLDDLTIIDRVSGIPLSQKDVGAGISQMLPLLAASFSGVERTILIEQPELHLHPAMQADLADAFITSATFNDNRFVIETHSEHLILRILRRVRETTEGIVEDPNLGLQPQDVNVMYISTGEEGARIDRLPVTPDGDFERPWPHGFFAERLEEL